MYFSSNKRVLVKNSCTVTCLKGEVNCMDIILTQGKSIKIEIDETMPFIEIRAVACGSHDSKEEPSIAMIRGEESLQPPLELEKEFYHRGSKSNNSSIVFSREFRDKVALLRTALTVSTKPLKTILIVGDRKCGKSTACRYIANNLSTSGDVYLVDTDCGQPLSHIPGFIHLSKVKPGEVSNSTVWRGQQIPHECIMSRQIGDFSPEHFPTIWMNQVSELVKAVIEKQLHGTLIVNTGGAIRGSNMEGIQGLIKLFKPQVIFELIAKHDSLVKHLPGGRMYNHISTRSDCVSSKISVLTARSLLPDKLRESFGPMRDARNAAFVKYFEQSCMSFDMDIGKLCLNLLINDQKQTPKLLNEPIETLGLLLVGSICSLETTEGSEIPVLVEDCDPEKKCLTLRIQSDRLCELPSTSIKLSKSVYSSLDISMPSVTENWQNEIERNGILGKKFGWHGPVLGVGAKNLRRKVSSRKK